MKYMRIVILAVTLAIPASLLSRTAQAAALDLKEKIVLANPEKYQVALRFGTKQRNVQPRKASVFSPKTYPLTLEFWSGKTGLGWKRVQIPSAGVYDFRWQSGGWELARRALKAASVSRPRTVTTYKRPAYRNSTGSYNRTVRGPTYINRGPTYVGRPPVYRGGIAYPRWSFWCRGIWGLARLYEFIRDEEDRDIMRDIIIGREVDDAIRREIEDRWHDRLVALPHLERLEIERAIDDIERLNDEDWRHISSLPSDDWDRLQDEIDWDDADWEGLGGWIDDIDSDWGVGDADLDDLGIATMDENIDLGDLDDIADSMDLDDAADNLDLEFGEDIDLGDIVGGADTLDLSDFDDTGYQGGLDLGDLDGGDIDIGDTDIGGGWDDGGGFDIDPGDYDAGGFDDVGGGWDDGGGDWGGGGGDWGGGFDDFGGGDFGGGFDDFGGGGDFFDF